MTLKEYYKARLEQQLINEENEPSVKEKLEKLRELAAKRDEHLANATLARYAVTDAERAGADPRALRALRLTHRYLLAIATDAREKAADEHKKIYG